MEQHPEVAVVPGRIAHKAGAVDHTQELQRKELVAVAGHIRDIEIGNLMVGSLDMLLQDLQLQLQHVEEVVETIWDLCRIKIHHSGSIPFLLLLPLRL